MNGSKKLPWPGSRSLALDAPSGVSGDMFLAALADLGFDLGELGERFRAAGVELDVSASETRRGGLRGKLLEIDLPKDEPTRGLSDCLGIIDKLDLPEAVRRLSGRFFERLAEAESRVHGLPVEKIHFHEVGALDSLVDLVGAALGLFRLDVGELRLRDISLGRGIVRTEHGELPLPAPATLELLAGFPLRESGRTGELVTPTGAVILACAASPMAAGTAWRLQRTGFGAGRREIEGLPNLLRLGLSEAESVPDQLGRERIAVLQCGMDDLPPEAAGHLMGRLLDDGALDVGFSPLQMKKNRPGLGLEILCRPEDVRRLARLLFRESTTLGLRVRNEERWVLDRELVTVSTPYGDVRMKTARLPGGGEKASPEYEDCAKLAERGGVALMDIDQAAREAWRLLCAGKREGAKP